MRSVRNGTIPFTHDLRARLPIPWLKLFFYEPLANSRKAFGNSAIMGHEDLPCEMHLFKPEEPMSLKLSPIPVMPEDTARIARAAFPKGTPYLVLRDELGVIFTDEDFTDLFSQRGQRALAP